MASISAMPPSHMLPANSPQAHQTMSQPHGMPTHAHGHGYSLSFDSQQNQPMYSQSFPNGPVSNPGFARSFMNDPRSHDARNYASQIYTVSECEARGRV